jgi:hypothetical protein
MQFDNGACCKGHIHMVLRMIPCKFEVRMHENEIIVNSQPIIMIIMLLHLPAWCTMQQEEEPYG